MATEHDNPVQHHITALRHCCSIMRRQKMSLHTCKNEITHSGMARLTTGPLRQPARMMGGNIIDNKWEWEWGREDIYFLFSLYINILLMLFYLQIH